MRTGAIYTEEAMQEVIAERDVAVARAEKAERELETRQAEWETVYIEKLRERNEALDRAEKAERERDEARTWADRWRKERDEAERERDEARAKLASLKAGWKL